jgi:putative drug exporter of the RND superfamily
MSSALYRLGRWSADHPWRVIGMWLAAAVMVIATASAGGRALQDSFEVPGLDSQRALALLTSASSDSAGVTARIVVTPTDTAGTFFADGNERAALSEVHAAFSALPNVLGVSNPAEDLRAGQQQAVARGSVSPDGRIAVMTVQYALLSELDPVDLERFKDTLEEVRGAVPLQVEGGGELFFSFEQPETSAAELLGIGAAVVILLLAFGSVIAMGLPIGLAVFGLVLGISSMSLITYLVEIPSFAPQMGSMIGLGVGIDYALFLVTRHREFLAQGLEVADAAGRAVATAGQAVIFAGGTVVIAILGLAAAGVPFLTAAGIATSVIVLLMVIASVTLLPALLGLSGPWVNRLSVRRRGVTGSAGVSVGWTRWGRHVSRHALAYTVGTSVLLIGLAAPVVALRLGFPDEGTQSTSRTERRAYDLVAEGFGPGVNGPLLIAIDISQDASVVGPLAAAVAEDPGIAAAIPAVDESAGVATIVAIPSTAPQDSETYATVQRLRAEVFPAVLDDSPASAHIGGQTATFGDIANRVTDRLPLFVGAVVVLSFLLLMVLFRSVLVALKAALLNLLSIGAAYGVLVMVFQWGWGKDLIGLESTVPIVSFVPMFMFAVLFGLSMDYEVFLLTRIREAFVQSGDNDASVIAGIAATARVITSAALIMISVFGGFVLGDDPILKMTGLGLATAILVDATIVRIVLVPASMTLLGKANWWLPAWLDRLLPTIDIEGGPAATLPRPGAVGERETVAAGKAS